MQASHTSTWEWPCEAQVMAKWYDNGTVQCTVGLEVLHPLDYTGALYTTLCPAEGWLNDSMM